MRLLVVVGPNFRRDELATGDYTFALVTTLVTSRWMRHGFHSPTAHTLCGMCGLARVSSHLLVLLGLNCRVSDTVFGQLIASACFGAIASEGSADSRLP